MRELITIILFSFCFRCTIVFLSPYREKQTHLLNDSRKAVTCLTYSPDGRYLATGEYGHQPSIRIWDLSDNTKCYEFTDHKCGINCLVSAKVNYCGPDAVTYKTWKSSPDSTGSFSVFSMGVWKSSLIRRLVTGPKLIESAKFNFRIFPKTFSKSPVKFFFLTRGRSLASLVALLKKTSRFTWE